MTSSNISRRFFSVFGKNLLKNAPEIIELTKCLKRADSTVTMNCSNEFIDAGTQHSSNSKNVLYAHFSSVSVSLVAAVVVVLVLVTAAATSVVSATFQSNMSVKDVDKRLCKNRSKIINKNMRRPSVDQHQLGNI